MLYAGGRMRFGTASARSLKKIFLLDFPQGSPVWV